MGAFCGATVRKISSCESPGRGRGLSGVGRSLAVLKVYDVNVKLSASIPRLIICFSDYLREQRKAWLITSNDGTKFTTLGKLKIMYVKTACFQMTAFCVCRHFAQHPNFFGTVITLQKHICRV